MANGEGLDCFTWPILLPKLKKNNFVSPKVNNNNKQVGQF